MWVYERPGPGLWEFPVMRDALARPDISAVYHVLKRYGKAAMGAAVTGADIALLANPAVATPAPNRVGETEVGQLRALTRMLWAQERQLGGGAVREA